VIFKVFYRRCLEDLLLVAKAAILHWSAKSDDRSLSGRRFSKVSEERCLKRNEKKKERKEKEGARRNKSPFDFFFAPLKARVRIDCAIKTRTGLKK